LPELAANPWTSNLAGSEAASQSLPHTTRTSVDPLAIGEWIGSFELPDAFV
jgi:hypothetical protein